MEWERYSTALTGCLASTRVKFALSSIPHELPFWSFLFNSGARVLDYWMKKRLFSPHSSPQSPPPQKEESPDPNEYRNHLTIIFECILNLINSFLCRIGGWWTLDDDLIGKICQCILFFCVKIKTKQPLRGHLLLPSVFRPCKVYSARSFGAEVLISMLENWLWEHFYSFTLAWTLVFSPSS